MWCEPSQWQTGGKVKLYFKWALRQSYKQADVADLVLLEVL